MDMDIYIYKRWFPRYC